jgi:hypothetical protein
MVRDAKPARSRSSTTASGVTIACAAGDASTAGTLVRRRG